MKRCGQCNALMPDDELCCIRCGTGGEKSAALKAPLTLLDKQVESQKRCPKCGHIHPIASQESEAQCPSCGIIYEKYLEQKEAVGLSGRSVMRKSDQSIRAGGEPCYLGLIASLSLFTGLSFLVCGVIWFACKDTDELAVGYAQEGINHQITIILGIILGIIPGGILMMFSPSLAIAIGIACGIFYFATPIIAAVKACKGLTYRYPLVIHFFGNVYSD